MLIRYKGIITKTINQTNLSLDVTKCILYNYQNVLHGFKFTAFLISNKSLLPMGSLGTNFEKLAFSYAWCHKS